MAYPATPTSRYRQLTGFSSGFLRVLLVAIPVVSTLFVAEVHSYLRIVFYKEQYMGVFLALVLGAVFLAVPATKRGPRYRIPWYDLLLCLLGLAVGLYVAVLYPRVIFRIAYPSPDKVFLGIVGILIVLEATRRTTGWTLVGVASTFILYARFTHFMPGALYAKGIPWEELAISLYLDANGMLGFPTWVISTMVFAFIFFGQMLFLTGGGKFLTEFSLATMGRFRGGPAKMALVASTLFGTISGSAVANVSMTGVVTIPLMKNTGYRPHVAGAIEAVASTGGQLAPPVMGIAAFLMAEFLSIPYAQVALAAVIPAALYYIALFTQVDLEAAKQGLRGLPKEQLPALGKVLHQGWFFLVPLVVVVYALFILNFSPGKAGIAATAVVLVLSFVRRHTRPTLSRFVAILEATGRAMLDIGVIGATVGFVIGTISLSGVGFIFSFLMVGLGEGNLLLLLALTALVSIILGMGLPAGAVYILLAVMVGSAMEQLGILPIAAHMFFFYFGMLSMITPPVCLATFAAASIAGSDPLRTGIEAVRLGVIAYIVPFIFIFSPALLMQAPPLTIVLSAVTATVGAVLLGIALSGFLFRRIVWGSRLLLTVGSVALLIPPGGAIALSWPINL
ncbi:MAG: TRAP transporter permease, partial [Anaerolineae bacterium]